MGKEKKKMKFALLALIGTTLAADCTVSSQKYTDAECKEADGDPETETAVVGEETESDDGNFTITKCESGTDGIVIEDADGNELKMTADECITIGDASMSHPWWTQTLGLISRSCRRSHEPHVSMTTACWYPKIYVSLLSGNLNKLLY